MLIRIQVEVLQRLKSAAPGPGRLKAPGAQALSGSKQPGPNHFCSQESRSFSQPSPAGGSGQT
ncbi:MAG: hypothetical protein ACOC3Y_02080, partial [Desulfohalobiaceae bacterium]